MYILPKTKSKESLAKSFSFIFEYFFDHTIPKSKPIFEKNVKNNNLFQMWELKIDFVAVRYSYY